MCSVNVVKWIFFPFLSCNGWSGSYKDSSFPAVPGCNFSRDVSNPICLRLWTGRDIPATKFIIWNGFLPAIEYTSLIRNTQLSQPPVKPTILGIQCLWVCLWAYSYEIWMYWYVHACLCTCMSRLFSFVFVCAWIICFGLSLSVCVGGCGCVWVCVLPRRIYMHVYVHVCENVYASAFVWCRNVRK